MSARDDLLEMLTAYTREMAGSDHMQSHAEEYARRDLDAYRAEVLASVSDRLDRLYALEAAGVDNWSGYEYAMEILNGD